MDDLSKSYDYTITNNNCLRLRSTNWKLFQVYWQMNSQMQRSHIYDFTWQIHRCLDDRLRFYLTICWCWWGFQVETVKMAFYEVEHNSQLNATSEFLILCTQWWMTHCYQPVLFYSQLMAFFQFFSHKKEEEKNEFQFRYGVTIHHHDAFS